MARSRGLGDVYKRQIEKIGELTYALNATNMQLKEHTILMIYSVKVFNIS
jgi:hypothetical protein